MRRHRSITVLVAAGMLVASCSSDATTDDGTGQPAGSSRPVTDDDVGADDATTDDATAGAATADDITTDDATAVEATADEVETAGDPDGEQAAWAPCDDLDGFECATVTAPLDYGDSDGPTIDLALVRLPSAGLEGRIGSIVFNPGGPGGSGIEYLEFASLGVPDEVKEVFDLVSFDPRGVGASSSVECDLMLDDGVALIADDDRAAWDVLLDDMSEELATCTVDGPPGLVDYVGTNNAARDLDLIRQAIGDDLLTYVGYSYGTRLGATYAELFPDRVRALVLDGAVKPSLDFAELGAQQAAGFDRALGNFAAACDADPDCILGEIGPTLDVLGAVRQEIAEVGSFETDDPERVLTPGEADLGVLAALYSKDTWPILAQALYLAETTADGSILQVLGDSYAGRRPDGTYSNQTEAGAFINCADDTARLSADEVWAENDAIADASEFFSGLLRAGTGCLGLPDPVDPLLIGPATGAPPILVIGTTGDPATPYQWSVDLAGFLDSGVLYTVEGEGHTAYTSIDCVAPVVNAYLIDLEVPGAGASCVDDAGTDFFVPAGESELDQVLAFFACLRDEGVEIDEVTLSDLLADPTGEQLFAEIDLTDPVVGAAIQACLELLPL